MGDKVPDIPVINADGQRGLNAIFGGKGGPVAAPSPMITAPARKVRVYNPATNDRRTGP
jgi:hypothetical protein